ncbi:MAG: transglycosylase SLT domain-containing protein [Comamonas sp.]
MKLMHHWGLSALSALLLLTGCATTGNNAGDASKAKTASAAGTTPNYPVGPLRPIDPARIQQPGVANLAVPEDIWDRIRRGFAMPDLDSGLVSNQEQWYANRPDYILRMTERSRKYMFHIVEELERRNMPTELALLPFIESAYNPQAVSSAKAAGMWQFMPATGTYFDLKQNMFRDDRRDVLASTRAALDYLQKLYGMFGDWQLALAAYNWGEGSVGRALEKNRRAGLGLTYPELQMPEETRNYVPKLQAVKNLIAHPERFQAELPTIENHPYFQAVPIDRDIDVALVAQLAGISLDELKSLNPSFNKPVILASGTPQVLLPWDNANVFKRNLQAHEKGQYASWTVWTAPTTMTVAAAAGMIGMSEGDLRSVNNIPPRMAIKAGSALMVPRSTAQQDVSSQVADNARIALTPEIVNRRTTVRARKGDTVAKVAHRYRMTAAQVADWNDVGVKSGFKAGHQVVLYLPVKLGAPAPRLVAQEEPEERAQPRRGAKGKHAAPRATAKAQPRGNAKATKQAAAKPAPKTAASKTAAAKSGAGQKTAKR